MSINYNTGLAKSVASTPSYSSLIGNGADLGLSNGFSAKDITGLGNYVPTLGGDKEFDTSNLLKSSSLEAPSLSADMKSRYENLGIGDSSKKSEGFSFGMDGESIQGYAQLGGLAMQLLGYSDQKKHQRAQTAGLRQNIAQQKIDNEFRAAARSNLNTPMANSNTGIA